MSLRYRACTDGTIYADNFVMDIRTVRFTLFDRDYSPDDCEALAEWLNDRDAGYPARNLPWPA